MNILIYVCILTFVGNSYEEDSGKLDATKLSRKELYKHGFIVKRAEQLQGVKRIQKMDDYSKKYAMIKILLEKLFKVLMNAKMKVIEIGYIPGEEFPEKEHELDALGNVFENVALFSDLLLRCPDITHKLYDVKPDWKVAMNWGIMFSNETGVFTGKHAELLNLVGQELELIPRDENYINPYKEAYIKAEQKRLKAEEEAKKETKEKKKSKKKIKKGPRLGGSSGEL